MLEATLQSYPGTLLLVSHDRTFLDNVVTQTLVAEGPSGMWKEYVGGYSDWVAQRASIGTPGMPEPPTRKDAPRAATKSIKLTFKEQRELDALPAELEALEREQHALTLRMSAPDYHRLGPAAIKADRLRAAEIGLLAAKFERGALDARARAPT